MIRRSPAEFYIKHLVVHPDGHDNAAVSRICTELGLVHLGDGYVEMLRTGLRPPDPFRPMDELHVRSRVFLRKERIFEIFHPDQAMRSALAILGKPRVRELVEVSLLSGAPSDLIAYGVKSRFDFECDPEAISLYRHYFWAIDLVDSHEMRAILALRHEPTLGDDADPGLKAQQKALYQNRHSDPRIVAARLPASPLSAILAQVELGVMPKRLDLIRVLEGVRDMAAFRAWEATQFGGPKGAATAVDYMTTASIATEILDNVIKPEDRLREDLQNLAIKTSGTKVRAIAELSGGQHTTSVQPDPEPEERQ